MPPAPNCTQRRGHAMSGPERAIRSGCGLLGFYSGEKVWVEIHYYGGFEYFNTRPYHNYEQWGHGFQVKIYGIQTSPGYKGDIGFVHIFEEPIVKADECLDCAVEMAFKLAFKKREELEAESE